MINQVETAQRAFSNKFIENIKQNVKINWLEKFQIWTYW